VNIETFRSFKLPAEAKLEVCAHQFYRYRLPDKPWVYCMESKTHRPLCEERPAGKLLVYKLKGDELRTLNAILVTLGFRGKFYRTRDVIFYTHRWPYPRAQYFPDMLITRNAKVLNGLLQEQADRTSFRTWLGLYLSVLKRHGNYRSKYPLPDDTDCPYCRGKVSSYRTMYAPRNHLRRHLGGFQIFGTLLWNALEAEGYADAGKLSVLGYGEAPAQSNTLCEVVSKYFKTQGGF